MSKGRKSRGVTINNRRCLDCKKKAKDLIGGEYLCRIHSPMRDGFVQINKTVTKK